MTLEEVNSQIALEYGQAMTVRVLKADGEVMRKSFAHSSSTSVVVYFTNFLQSLLPKP